MTLGARWVILDVSGFLGKGTGVVQVGSVVLSENGNRQRQGKKGGNGLKGKSRWVKINFCFLSCLTRLHFGKQGGVWVSAC